MNLVAVEVDRSLSVVQILEAARVAQVAAQADVIVEEAHHAGAGVPAEHVVRRGTRGQRAAVNLRAERPMPPVTKGRTPAPCVPPIGMPTIRLPMKSITVLLPKSFCVTEEAGAVPEGHFAADDAPAHAARVDAERRAAVSDVAAELRRVRADPRATKPSARACIGAEPALPLP